MIGRRGHPEIGAVKARSLLSLEAIEQAWIARQKLGQTIHGQEQQRIEDDRDQSGSQNETARFFREHTQCHADAGQNE